MYARDRFLHEDGSPVPRRAWFVRDDSGSIAWLRLLSRLHRKK
jgi:hypothetical protein